MPGISFHSGKERKTARWNFAEQMLHIAQSNVFFASSFLGGTDAPDRDYTAEGKSKEETAELLEEAFDYCSSVLSSLTDEQLHEEVETFAGVLPMNEIVLFMRDHVTHHRGQSVVYLRLNGIVPPTYVGA